jgi:hypothetical protein
MSHDKKNLNSFPLIEATTGIHVKCFDPVVKFDSSKRNKLSAVQNSSPLKKLGLGHCQTPSIRNLSPLY